MQRNIEGQNYGTICKLTKSEILWPTKKDHEEIYAVSLTVGIHHFITKIR